ncbi:glycosyltransferase, partial [bacterium]|nr:glycosyltransferase [bacterium]
MDLSVVIIHYKMKDVLVRCLESIFSQSFHCQFEVILVNKESGDGTRQVVSKRFPQVRYIDHTRFGIAFSRN